MPFDPAKDAKKVQGDLIILGYLEKGADDGNWGGGSKRAVKRFKRRAATSLYRIHADTNAPADATGGDLFKGAVDENVTDPTLEEIKKWLTKKWKAPLGRFKITAGADATLREDVSADWLKLVTKIKGLGGTIDGPYGDTKRGLRKVTKVGASSFSFHIVGRAVDLNQGLGGPPDHRYFVVKDFGSTGDFWCIWCKTEKQDGSQGKEFKKGDIEYWSFWGKKSIKIPAGWYLDLTGAIMADGKFERIKAHSGWEHNTNKSEWWHIQWAPDKQATFEDECELIGITTKELKNAGYDEADRDHAPG